MRRIHHTTTLVYYDGPQVWEARDDIGGHYIGVMVEPAEGQDRHMIVGVEPERLRQFRVGAIDLRSLLLERNDEEWFLATVSEQGDDFVLEPQTIALLGFPQLPESGFFLHDSQTEVVTLRESRLRNNLVLEVAIEPPEAALEHRIHTETLASLLIYLQTMVKHAYSNALREFGARTRQSIDRVDAHILDVVVFAPGSFRIVMEASKKPTNLFGMTEMGRALEQVDILFADVSDPRATLETIKEHRGRLAGAYLRLLRFLVKSKSGFNYSWAEPAFTEARRHSLSESEAIALVDVLSSVSNLSSETVVIVGSLKKADIGNSTWRIATEDGEISGTVKDGGPSLAGLKIDSVYRFTCLEETEEDYDGWRERRILYLTEYEPV